MEETAGCRRFFACECNYMNGLTKGYFNFKEKFSVKAMFMGMAL